MTPLVVADEAAVVALAARLIDARALAVDVESNGLHAYRQRLCALQIAIDDGRSVEAQQVVVVDTLAAPVAPLAEALGPSGPRKVLHDLAFDARILRDHGVALGHVVDTSVAARLLGRPALGLASLVAAELGVTLSKGLQQHDWARRPWNDEHLDYLASDVAHLFALEDRLSSHVRAAGLQAEVAEETAYKLREALAPPPPGPPAYLRVKGLDRMSPPEQAIVLHAHEARERAAEADDLPTFRVLHNEALIELARRKPTSPLAVRSLLGGPAARDGRLAEALAQAVRRGLAEGRLPDDEVALLSPPPPPADVLRTARAREARLKAFRRREAAARGVDEQAVLPGHCVRDLVALAPPTLDDLARVAGLGAFRVERYGRALLEALHADGDAPPRQASPPRG